MLVLEKNNFRLTDTCRIALCNEFIDEVNKSLGVNSPNIKKILQNQRKARGDIGSSLHLSLYKDDIHHGSDLAYCCIKKIVIQLFVDCK